ncbi:lisH domain-containing protein ARMC9-like isoform X2 [Amphiura filiformis]|uniref:lisH domain-containing protein ARMC9-like isoform X2 n=1 Tax=Amphiura filiformis TaxID=82378 RepID=UPI003B21ABDE
MGQEKQDLQLDLLSSFKVGAKKEFFILWDENVPESVRQNDPVCKKLEFYLNIYFAIYPIKYHLLTGKRSKVKIEETMTTFKHFLETRGAPLSQTTEFLPFYALPFVPDPTKHPSYKELFQDNWVPDLQIRLEKFLSLTLPARPQPRLCDIYQDINNKNTEQMQRLQQSVVDAEKKTMTYIKRFNKLQSDYHNLIGITAELVDSLEQCINGNMVTPEYLQTVCSRLFSNQLRESVDVNRPATAASIIRASFVQPSPIPEEKSDNEVPLLPSLDYEKVREDMLHEETRKRALLLQALRWRLTRSEPGEQRDTVLAAFIQHDILGCSTDDTHTEAVLQMLTDSEEVIQQYNARLFNAFASLTAGRNYLGKNGKLIGTLQKALQSEEKDSITRENVLGTLQKLSLKRHLQSEMIESSIIDWLVQVLEDYDSLSDYTLEYSIALLMNLCLRTTGKKKCIPLKARILKVLSDLLGHDDQEIRPYVNGTLYSILSLPEIREEAKAMGMEEILKCFIKDDTPEMNRQIHFIIKQLNSDVVSEDPESDDEEEEDEEEEEDQDAMEADLDKAEVVKATREELSGEKLLSTEYLGILTNAPTPRPPSMDSDQGLSSKGSSRSTSRHSKKESGDALRSSSRTSHHSVNGLIQESKRPPTRSGSRGSNRPSSHKSSVSDSQGQMPPNKKDPTAERTVSQVAGEERPSTGDRYTPKPSQKAMQNLNGKGIGLDDYSTAFGSRPKIPRTPEHGSRPSSRGMTPPPAPKVSDSPPLSRPGTSQSRYGQESKSRMTPVENVERLHLNTPNSIITGRNSGRSRVTPGSAADDPALTPLSQLDDLDDPNITPLSQLGIEKSNKSKTYKKKSAKNQDKESNGHGRFSAMTSVDMDDPALTPLSQIDIDPDAPRSARSKTGRQSKKSTKSTSGRQKSRHSNMANDFEDEDDPPLTPLSQLNLRDDSSRSLTPLSQIDLDMPGSPTKSSRKQSASSSWKKQDEFYE